MKRRIISIAIALVLAMGIHTPFTFASAQSITMTGATFPQAEMFVGSGFVVKGKITSDTKLTSVKVGMTDTSGKWLTGFHLSKNPKAKKYDISNLDKYLLFGKLPAGEYKYKVWAKNRSGKSKTLINAAFTVTTSKIENLVAPARLYLGKAFAISGKITSKYNLTSVKAGITDTAGKWLAGQSKTVKPGKKTYNIKRLDAALSFGNLDAGTYRFKVYIKDKKKNTKYIVNQKFTVSKMVLSDANAPTTLNEGASFSIRGKIQSHFKMTSVKVGVATSAGDWTRVLGTATVSSKKYNIKKLDSKVVFGNLSDGTYYYKIWAKDAAGKSKTLKKTRFTVLDTARDDEDEEITIDDEGKVLSYRSETFAAIGKQPYSGPCGAYAMAYCRMVIDGKFTKGNYASIQSRIIGSYYAGRLAQWSVAGGSSIYYSSAKSGYKAVLAEIAGGKPCILRIQNGYTGNQHYVTVIGYLKGTTAENVTRNSFIILDPAYGTKKYIKNMKYYDKVAVQVIKF